MGKLVGGEGGKVVGMEYVGEGMEDGKVKWGVKGMEKRVLYGGEMKEMVRKELIGEEGGGDVMMREGGGGGMENEVMEVIVGGEGKGMV